MGEASDYLRWYVLFVCGACLYWNEIDHGILGIIGALSCLFCFMNPCGILTLIFGMIAYFQDLRRDAHSKELIGYKWLVFPVGFIATLIMFCENAVVFVRATGGA